MSHKNKHKDKKNKREKIKQFLRESEKHLKKIAKRALRDLPPEAQELIKGAVRTTLDVLSGTFPSCLLPESTQAPLAEPKKIPEPPREYTFQAIDDLVFERIQYIVSDASLSKNFSDHLLDPDDSEKGILADQIRNLNFPEVYNLIRRIHRELNQEKNFYEDPSPEAIQAIRGLMSTLTETREGKPFLLSKHKEVSDFIISCFQRTATTLLDQCISLNTMDDPAYYSLFVGNALERLRENDEQSWFFERAPRPR
jgi:hypothetical protein